MNKISQLELLSEGFWNNFTKPLRVGAGLVRGAVAGAAKALDYALPELTKPLQGAEAAARDIGDTAKQGYERYAKGIKDYIADNLNEMGYQIDQNAKVKRNGDNYVVTAYKIRRYDDRGNPQLHNNTSTFLADKHGNIVKKIGY